MDNGSFIKVTWIYFGVFGNVFAGLKFHIRIIQVTITCEVLPVHIAASGSLRLNNIKVTYVCKT